jgi:dTDP-4-amino-4,6-dideoxygalactose transaminase
MGSEDFASIAQRLDWRMSRVAGALLRATDHADLVRRRRANFLQLLEGFPRCSGIRPLFEHLPEGVSPLYFPLLADARDALHTRLAEWGVETHRFWTWSHPAIPAAEQTETAGLRARLLALPIHQGLDEADVSFIVEALNAVASGGR